LVVVVGTKMANENYLVLEASRPASVHEDVSIDLQSIAAQEPQREACWPHDKPAVKVRSIDFRLSRLDGDPPAFSRSTRWNPLGFPLGGSTVRHPKCFVDQSVQ
jgi:hypothetical protein